MAISTAPATRSRSSESTRSSSPAPGNPRENPAPSTAAVARTSSSRETIHASAPEPTDKNDVDAAPGCEPGDYLKTLRSTLSLDDDLAEQVAAPKNTVLSPEGTVEPARPASQDGKLRVTDFNVHHLRGRDPEDGEGPGQTDRIVEELRARPSDVYTLQEVPPDQAQELVDDTGYQGFFARTTESQGNLTLVHPELPVEEERKVLLNTGRTGDVEATREALETHEGTDGDAESLVREPRAAQLLRVRTPDGNSAVVTNTHFTAGTPTNGAYGQTFAAMRESQFSQLQSEVDSFAGRREAVVQAGDLNTWEGEVQGWNALKLTQGYQKERVEPEQLDWIMGRNLNGKLQLNEYRELFDGDQQVSDHPILSAVAPL